MPDIDDMSYEGEEIKLDRLRHIKYTIKGLKLIAKKFGSVVKAFDQMKTMNQEFDTETMDNLVLLLHAGLIHEDAKLTADDVENLLTLENMPIVFHEILEAFTGSVPQAEENSEGDPGAQPKEGSEDEPGESKSTSTELSSTAE